MKQQQSNEDSVKTDPSVTGSVMVVGGGIAGMQSALDLANSGYYVYLVEKSAKLWSHMVDQGSFEVAHLDYQASRATVHICGINPVDQVYCYDVLGSITGSMKTCGAKNASATHSACVLMGAEACVYECRW